ncbi:Exonuclease SbcC [Streptomyces murinus]
MAALTALIGIPPPVPVSGTGQGHQEAGGTGTGSGSARRTTSRNRSTGAGRAPASDSPANARTAVGRPGQATLVTPDARRRINLDAGGVGAASRLPAIPTKGFVKVNTWYFRMMPARH